MIFKFIYVAVVLTAVQGYTVDLANRQGSLNTYYLYTRDYDDAREPVLLPPPQEITNDTAALILLNLDTIVIVHGHEGDAFSTLNPLVKNAFFNEARAVNVNVIVVDWSTYTKQNYALASAAVPSVGRALGDYLRLLADQGYIVLNRLHLIGFNLGAHVVGFAGRALDGGVARITGLDPSRSQWGSNTPRLSKSDARYVEVIHTDGDGLLPNGIGTAIGHVDFFANGGSSQPGCLTHACSHNRAWELFAATLVRPQPLYGNLCSTNLQLTLNRCRGETLPVGGDSLYKRHGDENVFRVNTGRTYPY